MREHVIPTDYPYRERFSRPDRPGRNGRRPPDRDRAPPGRRLGQRQYPPPRSRRRVSAVAPRGRRRPEAESAGCGPEFTEFRVGYEPQPRTVCPGIGAERIAPVQLDEPAAVGQGHRAENGPSLIVLAVVLECLAVVALPALCDETYGILDAIAIFALGCVNPDPPAYFDTNLVGTLR